MAESTNNPNHTLAQRREDRAAEQLGADALSRWSELTKTGTEMVEKQIEFLANWHYCLGETLTNMQRMFGQQTRALGEQSQQQTRRM